MVEELKQDNSRDLFNLNEQETLTQFSSLLRINETVSKVGNNSFFLIQLNKRVHIFNIKEVLFVYVIYDSSEDSNFDLKNPSCLRQMSVLEMLVNRWVPEMNNNT